MATELAFLLTGAIVVIGFAGDFLFRRTSIPDVLILVLVGFMIGPLTGTINAAQLSSITPILASLALVVILFDGGLNLDLFKVLNEAPRSLILAVVGTGLSTIAVMIPTHFLLGWGNPEFDASRGHCWRNKFFHCNPYDNSGKSLRENPNHTEPRVHFH